LSKLKKTGKTLPQIEKVCSQHVAKYLARINFFSPSQKFGKLFIPNKETKEFLTEFFFLKREFLYLPFLLFGLEILQKVCQPKEHWSLTTSDTTEFF
jgi:hypothetical protein